jgi:2-C-methyl-D-erythritol 4-phosphate cytidylyltransferase/2-C-methyl-D-erythritol 2,4-cyclodiphosphate synthase
MSSVSAVIVAAGRGSRAGLGPPKQFRALGGRPVLTRCLEPFLGHARIGRIVAVIQPDQAEHYRNAIGGLRQGRAMLLAPVDGGEERQASVRAGLERLAAESPGDAIVLIHDAARPFVTAGLIDRAIDAGLAHGAAVPGIVLADTVKVVGKDAFVEATPERATLRAVQTPQAFSLPLILDAHRRAAQDGRNGFTDDAAIAEWAGARVHVFDGDESNVKLTTNTDFDTWEARLAQAKAALVPRVGTGFDVHAFAEGDHLWLGGIRIAHDRGVIAHSDGDVVLHALTDAVLGALAEGDIGVHFPPGDARWRDAASKHFLAFAVERLVARGGVLDHLDVTLVCETPRIGTYRAAMRARIAGIAGIPVACVSIKATTSEGLGFTGRREGIAAQAVASIRLPAEASHA